MLYYNTTYGIVNVELWIGRTVFTGNVHNACTPTLVPACYCEHSLCRQWVAHRTLSLHLILCLCVCFLLCVPSLRHGKENCLTSTKWGHWFTTKYGGPYMYVMTATACLNGGSSRADTSQTAIPKLSRNSVRRRCLLKGVSCSLSDHTLFSQLHPSSLYSDPPTWPCPFFLAPSLQLGR